MSTRAEKQTAVIIAEWGVVWISGNRIRRRLLLGEGDVVLDAVFLGEHVGLLSHLGLEELHVLVRDGKVNVGLTV